MPKVAKAVLKRVPWEIKHVQSDKTVYEKFLKDEVQEHYIISESKKLACTLCKAKGVKAHKRWERRWTCNRTRCKDHIHECTHVMKVSCISFLTFKTERGVHGI